MTCLALAVRHHDGDESAIGVMVGPMTSPFVEQHEAFMSQEGIHLCKPNVARRLAQLL
jgi:hypothetical protein